MKCMYCGFENPEKSKFCGKCGKNFGREQTSIKKVIVALIAIGILIIIYLALSNTAPLHVLTTISVSPPKASVDEGKTYNFFSLSQDQFGKPMTVKVIWASSDTSVGPIDNNGVFTAKTSGSTIITATSGSVRGTATVTVSPSPSVLSKIIVSPSTASIVVGQTQIFMESPQDQYSKQMQATISWISSDSNVGTINSNGVFTSLAPGTTTITAASGPVMGTAIMTVTSPPDKISNFRVNSISNKDIKITVDYSYNTDHGTNVAMGAYALKGGQKLSWFGYSPAKVIKGTGSGTIGLTFGLNSPPASETTDQIQVDIYVGGGSAFYSQKFDYSKTWSQGLTAPTQISPANEAVFNHYPRSTTLTWSAVSGAANYTIERQYCSPCVDYAPVTGLTSTSYTFNFIGAQPGRWRVFAVDANGPGPKSGWWGFSYTI